MFGAVTDDVTDISHGFSVFFFCLPSASPCGVWLLKKVHINAVPLLSGVTLSPLYSTFYRFYRKESTPTGICYLFEDFLLLFWGSAGDPAAIGTRPNTSNLVYRRQREDKCPKIQFPKKKKTQTTTRVNFTLQQIEEGDETPIRAT